MKRSDHLTWKDFKSLAKADPNVRRNFNRLQVSNYDEFIEALHDDLAYVISLLQDNRQHNKKSAEDLLTIQLLSPLSALTYGATHDTQIGGHVDIVVTYRGYRWLGEAKIWRSASYVHGGYQQLLSRYTSGPTNEQNGGLIIYFKTGAVKDKLETYKSFLESAGHRNLTTACVPNILHLVASQDHPSSGLEFSTTHWPVLLHFDPIK